MKCKCGCGLEANPGKIYILGHNAQGYTYIKPSTKRKISLSNKDRVLSNGTRERMSVGQKLRTYQPHSLLQDIEHGITQIGNQHALGNKSHLNQKRPTEVKQKISKANERYWSNPEKLSERTRLSIIANQKRPTKPEQVLIDIISDCGLSWVYNGNNGNVVIDGLCPDFVHKTQPIVLLVNGQYWHSNPSWELEVINRYKDKGFEVITLEDEEIYKSPEDYLIFLLATARASQDFHLVDSLSELINLIGEPAGEPN